MSLVLSSIMTPKFPLDIAKMVRTVSIDFGLE